MSTVLYLNRTVYDPKRQQQRRHQQVGRGNGSGSTAIVYDISDGSRTTRSISEGASRAKTSSTSSSGSMSCLVGLLVAASFIGIAVGMAFAIDRTVVALC